MICREDELRPPFCGTPCAVISRSDWLGCQYSGVAQFFNGTPVSCRASCAVSAPDARTRRETTQARQFGFTNVLLFPGTSIFVSGLFRQYIPDWSLAIIASSVANWRLFP